LELNSQIQQVLNDLKFRSLKDLEEVLKKYIPDIASDEVQERRDTFLEYKYRMESDFKVDPLNLHKVSKSVNEELRNLACIFYQPIKTGLQNHPKGYIRSLEEFESNRFPSSERQLTSYQL